MKTGHQYHEINFAGKQFQMYHTAMGVDEDYFSVHYNQSVIGVIQKISHTLNGLDTFYLFSETSDIMEVFVCMTTLLQMTAYNTADLGYPHLLIVLWTTKAPKKYVLGQAMPKAKCLTANFWILLLVTMLKAIKHLLMLATTTL